MCVGEGARPGRGSARRNYRGLYDRYASTHSGDDSPEGDRGLRRDFISHIPQGAARILDLGCGQGSLVRLCHISGYRETYGVDWSKEQIDIGRARGVSNLIVGDALEALRDVPEPVDVVFTCDFLEHLSREALIELLGAVHGVLAPGGVLVARTPNGVSPLHGFYFSGDATHEVLLSPRSLRQVAMHCGFEWSKVFSCPPVPHGVMSVARSVLWRLCEGGVRAMIRIETGQRAGVVTQNFVFVAGRGSAMAGR